MLYLIIAALFTSLQMVFTKYFQLKIPVGLKTSVMFSGMVALAATFYFGILCGFNLQPTLYSLACAIAISLMTIIMNALGIKALSLGSITMYSVFMMLGGMVLPFVYGLLVLNENSSVGMFAGLGLISVTLALPLMSRKGNSVGNKGFYWLCLAVFCLNGGISVVAKTHQINPAAMETTRFLALQSAIQVMLSLLVFGVLCWRDRKKGNTDVRKMRDLRIAGASVGAALFSGTAYWLYMITAKTLSASILFPLLTGMTILATMVIGFIIYKEKPTKIVFIEIILVIISLVLFSNVI